jgi:hypothetical protein
MYAAAMGSPRLGPEDYYEMTAALSPPASITFAF